MSIMKRYVLIISFFVLFAGCQSGKKIIHYHGNANTAISMDNIRTNLEFLASDELEGRETGSRGESLAAQYISSELQKYGLKPYSDEGYWQWFDLSSYGFDQNSSFSLIDGNGNLVHRFEYESDFVGSAKSTGSLDTTVSLVFAGYGITSEKYGYDDYAEIDVTGKVVLLYSGEPESEDSSYFDGHDESPYASSLNKMMTAKEHGAVGAIILSRWEKDFGWDKIVSHMNRGVLRLNNDEDNKVGKKFPVVTINEQAIKTIFKHANYSYQDLRNFVISNSDVPKFEFDDKIRINWQIKEQTTVTSRNILAVIEGLDPNLKHEFVAIGAHYDHIGMSGEDVYNGADDNASGTSAILEAGKALASAAKNKRSILVVLHSAEEKGLLGSKYLTENLSFIDDIIAYINLDMVGRGSSDSIYSIGSDKISYRFHQLIEEVNSETVNLHFNYRFNDLSDPKRFYYRSDHYSYVQKGIPSVFFFDFAMEDCHKITDDADKINYEKVSKIADLTYNLALRLANMDKRFEVDELVSR
jgi:hypothetical protein